jgi:hypothetical protein
MLLREDRKQPLDLRGRLKRARFTMNEAVFKVLTQKMKGGGVKELSTLSNMDPRRMAPEIMRPAW